MDPFECFGCVATRCTLTTAACGLRWRKAQERPRYDAHHPRAPIYLADCRNCPDGAERGGPLPALAEPRRCGSWGHKKQHPGHC